MMLAGFLLAIMRNLLSEKSPRVNGKSVFMRGGKDKKNRPKT